MKKLFLFTILALAVFACKKKVPTKYVDSFGNYEVLQKTEFWMITENGDTLSSANAGVDEVVDVQGVAPEPQMNQMVSVNGEYFTLTQFSMNDYEGKPWVHQLWLERQDKTNLQEGDVLHYHLGKYK